MMMSYEDLSPKGHVAARQCDQLAIIYVACISWEIIRFNTFQLCRHVIEVEILAGPCVCRKCLCAVSITIATCMTMYTIRYPGVLP